MEERKVFKILIALVKYWTITLSLAALIAASLNFIPAIDNFKHFSFIDFVKYEMPFLWRSIYSLFFLSGLFALPAFILNFILLLRNVRVMYIPIINLIFLFVFCVFADSTNLLLPNKSYIIVLPVYVTSILIFYYKFFSKKKREK
jgi:hypothetical protein